MYAKKNVNRSAAATTITSPSIGDASKQTDVDLNDSFYEEDDEISQACSKHFTQTFNSIPFFSRYESGECASLDADKQQFGVDDLWKHHIDQIPTVHAQAGQTVGEHARNAGHHQRTLVASHARLEHEFAR